MQVVPDMLVNAVARFGDRLCVTDGTKGFTFSESSDRASRFAEGLRGMGLERGDRVALLAMNELEYTEIQVACQRAEVTLVPLNFRLAIPELQQLVDDCAPSVLIHGPGFEGQAAQLGVGRTLHLGAAGHGVSYDELLASIDGAPRPAPLDPTVHATMMYTSGTTGRAKGAMVSNLALWSRMVSHGLDIGQRPGSVFLQCLPLFHISSNLGYSFTHGGGTNIFLKMFSPEAVFAHLEKDRPTHLLMVPTMINMVLNHPDVETADFSSVETIIYGASSIAPSTLHAAIDIFGCSFLQMYGMTETGCCAVLSPSDHDPVAHPERLASAGRDATGAETIIVDEVGVEVGPNSVGEILSRGPSVMSSYWGNAEASAEALAGGWMHTGDAGYKDADGYIYITDRVKDMVISGGENVYPREVEDVLFGHEAVLEAAVIGVPDDKWGERVHAVVVLREGLEASEQQLLEYCRAYLAGYKTPRSLEFSTALPRNAAGKVLKTELRAPHWLAAGRGVN